MLMNSLIVTQAKTNAAVPRVWLVASYRAGENSQLLALCETLGWPFESKRLVYKKSGFAINFLRGTGLSGIDTARSSPLTPPWPDLVISAGMRNEPVCRWIRRQAGGRTRLVHLGRPWARPARFDLVITTPQYRLPPQPNVLQNTTTLHRVTPARLAEAAQTWQARLAHLPRPRIAVLVGGNSGPYYFGHAAATRLARQACELANAQGGSLLLTTSARTPPSAAATLIDGLTCPAHCFDWSVPAGDNPYYGYLALADALIVTADSIAMLSDACATGKPTYIFDFLHEPATDSQTAGQNARLWDKAWLGAWFYRQLMAWGPRRLTRDVGLVQRALIAAGRAAWLGQALTSPPAPSMGDLQRAVTQVKALFTTTPAVTDPGAVALERSK